ncbi:transposase domain-containing protein [Leisingera sp. HS039]|uniref:transposase domain-containing protein n=2 Tax=unclassified Leisingera TaxID=2614906 RepID=UPI0032B41550
MREARLRHDTHRAGARLRQDGISAENWALRASLIANCKMCDVDPVSCLSGTLRALLDGHPRSRIDDLMPRNFPPASSRAAQGSAEALVPVRETGRKFECITPRGERHRSAWIPGLLCGLLRSPVQV